MNKVKTGTVTALILCFSLIVMAGCSVQGSPAEFLNSFFNRGESSQEEKTEQENTEEGSTASARTAEPVKEGVYRIGILQDSKTAGLDQAAEGFMQELSEQLGENVEYDEMLEDESTESAAERLVADGCCLILAAGTDSLEAAAAATQSVPVVGVGISDFLTAGVISSNESPDGNVTGVSGLVPVSGQIDLIEAVDPEIECVAILYDSERKSSRFQVLLLEQYLREEGINWKEYTGSDAVSVETAASRAAADHDCSCVFVPADVTIAENMETVAELMLQAKKPVITAEKEMCRIGGLAVWGMDYYDLGVRAADIAYEIAVDGASPSKTAIYYVKEESCSAYYNAKTASSLGWSAPYGMEVLEGTETAVENSAEASTEASTESAALEMTLDISE